MHVRLFLAISLVLSTFVAGCPGNDDDDDDAGGIFVHPVDSDPFGVSYAEWSVRWWEWVLSIPYETDVLRGGPCDQNQSGDVWFLGGNMGGEEARSCSVPHGNAIFFPVLNQIVYACPEVFGVDDCDYCTDAQLEPVLNYPLTDLILVLQVEVDGVSVADPADYAVNGGVFEIATPDDALSHLYFEDYDFDCGDPWAEGNLCEMPAGQNKLATESGYFVMVDGFEPGTYTLEIYGEIVDAGFYVYVTYELTIE